MDVQNNTPSKRRGRTMKKTERLTQEEVLQQILDDHKKNLGEVIRIKIDERTSIEVSANMSEKDRADRINNYLKNTNFKPVK